MKKPMSLQKFADRHKDNYDLIKEVIELCNKISHYQRTTHCGVCDKELTNEEINSVHPSHFNYCCTEHAKYRSFCLLEHIRKELGFPEELYLSIK